MKKEQTTMNKMGTMPMTRLILTMSLPAIFSMTILAMYNVVDSIFISRYDMDGFTACKKIREFKDIPVLMLSARGTEYDKLFGFEVGVDDYVTKPFSPKELMARMKVIINRHGGTKTNPSEIIKVGGIVIDKLGHIVKIDGTETELTAKEYGILLYLVENKGRVLSRDKILNAVWGYDYFGDDRTVDWQIKLLRNKLGKYRDSILTIRGVGYKFENKN